MTKAEVITVAVVIAILASVLRWLIIPNLRHSHSDFFQTTKSEIWFILNAIETYHAEHGTVMVSQPILFANTDLRYWKSQGLVNEDGSLRDPWGSAILVRNENNVITITSAGPDKNLNVANDNIEESFTFRSGHGTP